ncbi:GNAT family N-acetyltransferase [Tenggerimyces flavus]|uniref:GNAT family N-acetyltransferase n=1 Tax=Tenggerimyces flavus TaxID=1708749 RepID=A0ABV7YNL1_9ACTN|nr:GNAT family protein [Tenggerimyces flavus]MBM7786372.1 RimJ/RimL family protein N-acetyltransferase [Tenggerimyces flavus]
MTDWYEQPVLTGKHVRLEPIALEHAPELLAAADDDAVFQHLTRGRLSSQDDAVDFVRWAEDLRERRVLMPFAQLDVRGRGAGEVAGHTSYYEISPDSRSIAIGYTWLGKRWWRTGLNTESKLLLLTHAFDTLGAVRVVWHTDIRNERSQAAIARLGAAREGVLRKHKVRRDGTWRDTVQFAMTDDDWPDVRARLTARLEAA